MENFVLNGNGQIEIKRKNMDGSYTFHLQEINHNTELCSNKDLADDTATSVSSYSNYKQRIDAMFDDTKSVLSDMSKSDRRRKSITAKEETDCKERILTNNIQEKIEKMFEEISINGFQRPNSVTNRSYRKDQKSDVQDYFIVTYLGSKPLVDKNVSLMSLQDPLKDLYMEYKKNPSKDKTNMITITKEGLKIKVSDKEELNPFPSIAVWASVKLSLRKTSDTLEFAFLPLVTDPDGVDKNLLFKKVKPEDEKNFLRNDDVSESPIFAVVMKSISKNLQCHAFVCKSSEEAIVIAANLYQALMKKMKSRKDQKESKIKKIPEKVEISKSEENKTKPTVKVKKPAPPVPEKSTVSEEKAQSGSEGKTNEQKTESAKVEKKEESGSTPQRRGSVPNTSCEPPRTLRRTVSDRGGSSVIVKNQTDRGDILTKVAIPRTGSFLNAKGPLTRFSGRSKSNQKNESASPLGFKELFNELRFHEGLESMDDILNAIIDAEGMSFNDLKPIYKEFLLKLAVTLTKDELYQRSKSIMRRQKKRNKNTRFKKKAFLSTIGLGKIFRKTASRLGKTKSPRPTNLEFTSIVFQSTSKQFDSNLPNIRNKRVESRVKRRQSSRRRLSTRLEKMKSKHVSTTSEDSDFFQPVRNTNDSGGGPNRSSSGYFSCSECSCDSEKCTCTRTDKCYCTLGHKKSYVASSSDESRFLPGKKSSFRLKREPKVSYNPSDSLKSCSCDTDSCVDSAKCYCTQKENKTSCNNKTRFLSEVKGLCKTPPLCKKEEIKKVQPVCKKHGNIANMDPMFIASESTLSGAESQSTAWHTNESRHKSRSRTTGSQKYLPNQLPQFLCNYHHIEHQPHLQDNYFENVHHTCRYGSQKSIRSNFYPPSRRQYSSMRCRSDFQGGITQPLQRSVSYKTKNFFNSVRSKQSCSSIMNHIKFPNREKSSLRFTRRMDVYNSISENRHLTEDDFVLCLDNRKKPVPQYRFPSSETNGFHLFRTNSQLRDCMFNPENLEDKMNKKKMLVVSARDPRGKVLYMGTRCESSLKNPKNCSSTSNASEALSVKKSAEIAALFSDVTSKHKIVHLDWAKDQRQCNYAARSNSYRSTNLENTLGYLP